MASHTIQNVPYIYQGCVVCCHVTSLRMVLAYYGITNYSHSYLMNLSGFNYGFEYIRGQYWATACSEIEPWNYMSYAAEKIGCKLTLVKGKPWDQTWELLKSYIDKDTPVYMPLMNMKSMWKMPNDLPHIIVLCGYDEEKGLVIVHDPAFGEMGEGLKIIAPNELPPDTAGRYAEFKIEDFKKACDLSETPWAEFGNNALCAIKPPDSIPEISWSEVIDRNSRLILGQVEATGKKPNHIFGPGSIMALADDLENDLDLLCEIKKRFEILRSLRVMAFNVGYAQRRDASSFITGLAALTKSRDLEMASQYLRESALSFEQGLIEVDDALRDPVISRDVLKTKLSRIAELLRRAAVSDSKAGEYLKTGAKALK